MDATSRRRLGTYFYRMQRLKTASVTEDIYRRDQQRPHTVFELVLVGLGTILPLSLFVLAGQAAKDLAGPSSVLSLVFAALASGLAGLSYSELRARVYRLQASAYEYTYRVVGEAAAFVIGWMLLLHHVICTAVTSRAVSLNLDYLLENRISNLTVERLGDLSVFNSYVDFVALFLGLLSMFLVAVDFILSGRIVRLCQIGLTLVAVLFVLVAGLYHLDFHNWQAVDSFFPKGVEGVMSGALVLTYAFWGAESILRACDLNTRSMRKPAMTSILSVHIFSLVVLMLTLSAITLLTSSWQSSAVFPEAFTHAGMSWVRYVLCPVAILVLIPVLLQQFDSTVCSLCNLASDGLLPGRLAVKHDRTNTPLVAVAISGLTIASVAMVFSVSDLVQVLVFPIVFIQITTCIITVCFHYKPESDYNRQRRHSKQKRKRRKPTDHAQPNGTHVIISEAACYGATIQTGDDSQPDIGNRSEHFERMLGQTSPAHSPCNNNNSQDNDSSSEEDIDDIVEEYEHEQCVRHLTENSSPTDFRKRSTVTSFRRVRVSLVVFIGAATLLGLVVTQGNTLLHERNPWLIAVLAAALVAVCVAILVVFRQPRDCIEPYTVLLYVHHVPVTPMVALLMNIMMCTAANVYSALFMLGWLLTGLLVYAVYGMSHSHEQLLPEEFPDEYRGLIYQSGSSQRHHAPSTNRAHQTDDDVIIDARDDDQLIDCT